MVPSASQVSPGRSAEPTASVPALTTVPPAWVNDGPFSVSSVSPSLTSAPVPLTVPPKVEAAPPSVSVSFTTISAVASAPASRSRTTGVAVANLPFVPSVAVPVMSTPLSTVSVAPVTVMLPLRSMPSASVTPPRSTDKSPFTSPAKRTLPWSVLWTEIGVAARFVTADWITWSPVDARINGASPSKRRGSPATV